jgi:hypothetical protein
MTDWLMIGGMTAVCTAMVAFLWGSVLRKSPSGPAVDGQGDRLLVTVLSLFTIVALGYIALVLTYQ